MVKVNLKNTKIENKLSSYENDVKRIHKMIEEKSGEGNDFLGWTTWPKEYFNSEEYKKIKTSVARLDKEDVEAMVVIGIGGSYLGAKAGIDFVMGSLPNTNKEVYYAGINLSPFYMTQLMKRLENKKWSICIISKSGTTLEPALSFRLLREKLIEKEGIEKANKLTIAVTDGNKGTLKSIADEYNFDSFVIPDDIGGRFSVITPVGLVPLLFAGVNIDEMMQGAIQAQEDFKDDSLKNEAYKYAAARTELAKSNKIELMGAYEPNLQYFTEWWKQLFGESEGKDGKGLYPASVTFTADLHSLGQFIQEGTKLLFETIIWTRHSSNDISVPTDKKDADGLNYLADKSMHWINEQAYKGVLDAHFNAGGVENIVLEIDKMDSKTLGYMFFFFMRACAMSAYLLEVNPFNQPGVEAYKKSMFKLLGKK